MANTVLLEEFHVTVRRSARTARGAIRGDPANSECGTLPHRPSPGHSRCLLRVPEPAPLANYHFALTLLPSQGSAA